jgi:hypothetical protein
VGKEIIHHDPQIWHALGPGEGNAPQQVFESISFALSLQAARDD